MDFANKTPDPAADPPPPPNKPLPLSNGVLRRHAPPQGQTHLHPPLVVAYRECLKNHAASLGAHAVDGCGEFMPSPDSDPADPTSLRCAACGCHRNFHRRDPDDAAPPPPRALEYRPHHRHLPPPPDPPAADASPDVSPSPPPISSAYYPPSAPHMLLALSHGHPHPDGGASIPAGFNSLHAPLAISGGRKRFRTKFSQGQKEKMLELAERVEWKMQRKDDELINACCAEIGVEKAVFKVWMHNNKNNFGKKEQFGISVAVSSAAAGEHGGGDHFDSKENVQHHHHSSAQILGTANGSSSTS